LRRVSLQEASREIHKHIRARGYIGSAALGLSDGLVTNLAFLAGLAGAVSDTQLALIRFAGIASMLAGTISMFLGGFIEGRSEYDLFKADANREADEIEHEPEEEKSELENFYTAKGLTRDEAERVVDRIASNKKVFLEDILMHELHVHETKLPSPIKMGGVIGFSFLMGALIPLVPFLLLQTRIYSLSVSVIVSPFFLFLLGAWRGRLAGRQPWKGGLETLVLGLGASGVLYLIGTAIGFF